MNRRRHFDEDWSDLGEFNLCPYCKSCRFAEKGMIAGKPMRYGYLMVCCERYPERKPREVFCQEAACPSYQPEEERKIP